MSLSNKSQVWIEAMMLVFLFTAMLTFLGINTFKAKSALFKQNLIYQAKKTLELISGRINTVLFEGSGFSSNIILPDRIDSMDYDLFIVPDYVVLEINNMNLTSQIFAKSISGVFEKGENWVSNNNGTININ